MKKLLSIMLVAFMAFAFIACDNGNSEKWTVITTFYGLDGTWVHEKGYVDPFIISGGYVTFLSEEGVGYATESIGQFYRRFLPYGKTAYINKSKTQIKIVYIEEGETCEDYINKQ